MHQNTTHFTSSAENTQGSIGTTTIVPYSLVQIHGWLNPKVAEKTGLTEDDLKLMYEGLWYGTSGEGSSHSRSKVGQNSVLLLVIEYAKTIKKSY
jgi:CRISPR-associated protein Csh2